MSSIEDHPKTLSAISEASLRTKLAARAIGVSLAAILAQRSRAEAGSGPKQHGR